MIANGLDEQTRREIARHHRRPAVAADAHPLAGVECQPALDLFRVGGVALVTFVGKHGSDFLFEEVNARRVGLFFIERGGGRIWLRWIRHVRGRGSGHGPTRVHCRQSPVFLEGERAIAILIQALEHLSDRFGGSPERGHPFFEDAELGFRKGAALVFVEELEDLLRAAALRGRTFLGEGSRCHDASDADEEWFHIHIFVFAHEWKMNVAIILYPSISVLCTSGRSLCYGRAREQSDKGRSSTPSARVRRR